MISGVEITLNMAERLAHAVASIVSRRHSMIDIEILEEEGKRTLDEVDLEQLVLEGLEARLERFVSIEREKMRLEGVRNRLAMLSNIQGRWGY